MAEQPFIKLERYLVYLLRHHPDEVGLTLDEEGFVSITDVIAGLKMAHRYPYTTESMIREVVAGQPDKQRLEIQGNLIRARYGHSQHSSEQNIIYTPVQPPSILYHGTSTKNLSSILSKGLIPVSRQYVHLSETEDIATQVALRHSHKIIILKILCEPALQANIEFYHPEDKIWLAKQIPPQFIQPPA